MEKHSETIPRVTNNERVITLNENEDKQAAEASTRTAQES